MRNNFLRVYAYIPIKDLAAWCLTLTTTMWKYRKTSRIKLMGKTKII